MNLGNLQEKASQSLYEGEYNSAIALYEQCISANPDDLLNYLHLGLANFLQGDELTAQSVWLSVLLHESPEENEAGIAELIQLLQEAIVIQLQANNFQLAERICQQVLELNSGLPEVYYYMALCLIQKQKINDAIDCAKKAIELNPNFAEAYSLLGAFFRDRFGSDCDLAINYLQKAIELKPDYAEAYYNIAFCLLSKGNFDEAIGKLQEAIALKPEFSEAVSAIEYLVKCDQSGYAPPVRQGYKIWDAIVFKDNNLYRLFYLMGNCQASFFWSVGEVGAAISYDLKKWEYIGVVLKPDPTCEWQSGRMLSGSVYKENDIYYFFYSASPPDPLILNEGIGIATSIDGISWQRSENQLINLDTLDIKIYTYGIRDSLGGIKQHFACRDPYIFKEPKTNQYYIFITTSCQGKNSMHRGCIGLAVSSKIDGPYKVLPPAVYPKMPENDEGIFSEMERPQVVYRDGKYHLFFSCATHFINPQWIEKVGRERITPSSLYWYVSENITGPFVPTSAKPVVKGSERTGLYGTSLVEAPNGELIACGSNILTYTLEVSPRFPVRWENDSIEIIVGHRS